VFLPRELADAVTRYAGHLQAESGKFVSMGDVISLALEAYGPLGQKRKAWKRRRASTSKKEDGDEAVSKVRR
jgi:hypothetical protein